MKLLSMCLAGVLSMVASSVAAADKAALIAQIEAGGQNEYEDERHAVKVDDCQLTTYRWKKVEGEGWVLWTSFELPMLTVDLSESKMNGKVSHYVFIEEPVPMTVIVLKAKDGTSFTHEKSIQRKPKGTYKVSPRGEGASHFIETKTSGAIMQLGPDVREKAEMFTNGYIQYVQEFCTFTS